VGDATLADRCRAPGSALSSAGHVVGVEDGNFGGAFEAAVPPIMVMYIQEIGRMLADCQTGRRTHCAHGPRWGDPRCRSRRPPDDRRHEGRQVGLDDRSGPMPGPPPPWGMQKVLCRFMWRHVRADGGGGGARPTWAFMLAPSMYTWPPWLVHRWRRSRGCLLRRHAVGGRDR
jgi:hypothetical protein